jgi:hypothetical protein
MLNAMFKRDTYSTTLYYPHKSNWDDLRFASAALFVPGSGPPLSKDEDGALLLPNNQDSVITGIAQIPHDWWKGRAMKPHVHYECMGDPGVLPAGNMVGKLEYQAADVNGSFSGTWDTSDVIIPLDGVLLKHNIFGDPRELPLNNFSLSAIIKFRIWRMGTDELDTYTGDWKLLEFDLHYERGQVGSGQEYSI